MLRQRSLLLSSLLATILSIAATAIAFAGDAPVIFPR
jgi:hypothetical protein